MTLAFIGAGKMATAIARGLLQQDVFAAGDLSASDVSPAAATAFTASTGVTTTHDNEPLVAGADAVVLAVKPQVAEEVLRPLAGAFDGKLLISIAAGLSIAQLSDWIASQRVIRVMPNTPAMVGWGASVFACGSAVEAADGELARRILGAVGIAYEMPETCLDAVTGLSGSGPAYVFEFIQALVDGGVAVGLEATMARELVVQTVAGAAEMLRRGLGSPDELRVAVTSPGGTTAAGLEILEAADFRRLMARVVARATERSVELGRGA